MVGVEDWLLEPGVSFGPVRLGIGPDEVIALFGEPQFIREPRFVGVGATWIWHSGLNLAFDLDDRVVWVAAGRERVRAIFRGVNLLGPSGKPAMKVIHDADPDAAMDDTEERFESHNLDIGVSKPFDRARWDSAYLRDPVAGAAQRERLNDPNRQLTPDRVERLAIKARPWAIKPGRSVGPIRAGMTRRQVTRTLGPSSEAIRQPQRAVVGYDAISVEFATESVFDLLGAATRVTVRGFRGNPLPTLKIGRVVLDGSEESQQRLANAGRSVETPGYGNVLVDGSITIEPGLRNVRCDLLVTGDKPIGP